MANEKRPSEHKKLELRTGVGMGTSIIRDERIMVIIQMHFKL